MYMTDISRIMRRYHNPAADMLERDTLLYTQLH